jgi:hypothetical protein
MPVAAAKPQLKQSKQNCRGSGIGLQREQAKGLPSAAPAASLRRPVMFIYQKSRLRFLLVAAAALGCSASVLSGTLTALSLGAA